MKMLTMFFGLCLVFAFVWERVDMVRLGYQIERLKQERTTLERERDELRVKLSMLSAPDRIAKVASEKLGMALLSAAFHCGPAMSAETILPSSRSARAIIPGSLSLSQSSGTLAPPRPCMSLH